MIHRRGAEAQRAAEEDLNVLSERVIGAAIEVHRHLGPGLLESIYEECLARELELRGLTYERQVPLVGSYKGILLEGTCRIDLIVAGRLLVELKAVDGLHDVHTAQMLTYLRLSEHRLGLLINFNVPALWKGIRRIANQL